MAVIVRADDKNFNDYYFSSSSVDILHGWAFEIKGGLETISLSIGAFAAAVITLTN